MIRNVIFLFILIGFTQLAKAQLHGNEWVKYDQEYYKIKVLEKGLYEVGYGELLSAGVPVDAVNPEKIQLWHRGKELAFELIGEEDGVFDSGDFIRFYGHPSDGELETELFANGVSQTNNGYSLYSDTSFYFLTWNQVDDGKRIVKNASLGITTPIKEVKYDFHKAYYESYSRGEEPVDYVFKSEFDKGEGWMSYLFGYTVANPTRNVRSQPFDVKGNTNVEIEIELVGRNKRVHNVEIIAGDSFTETRVVPEFQGYTSQKLTYSFNSKVIEDGQMKLQVFAGSLGGDETDYISIASLRITTTDSLLILDEDIVEFQVISELDGEIIVPNYSSSFLFYDVSDEYSVNQLYSEVVLDDLSIEIPEETSSVIAFDTTKVLSPFEVEKAKPFVDDLINADYVILSHEAFWSGAQDYAAYRTSSEGGNHTVLLVDFERILDQYGYGEKNPLAVKKWLKYLVDNNQKPAYFFIIGDGASHHNQNGSKPFMRHLPFMALNSSGDLYYSNQDFIFSYGDPGWDMGFSVGLDSDDPLLPSIPTGRLACRLNQEVNNYLNKVKEFELPESKGLWRKRAVHLSGGRDANEHQTFLNNVNGYKEIFESPEFGGEVVTYSKKSSDVVEFFNISKEVNEGVGIITYIGHSSPTFIEVDIGTVSEEINGYRNKGKYPMLFLNGCSSGDIFSSRSRAQDWLNTADRGAIAALAHVSFGYSGELNNYCEDYYSTSYQDSLLQALPIGDLQVELIKKYTSRFVGDNPITYTQAQQMFLLGDPAIALFPDTLPDYTVEQSYVMSLDDNRVTAASDSFLLNMVVSNYGRVIEDSFSVCLIRSNSGNNETQSYGPIKFPSISFQDTISLTVYNLEGESWGGSNDFEIRLNCDGGLDQNPLDDDYDYRVYLSENGVNHLYPSDFSIVGDSIIDFFAQTYNLNIDSTEFVVELDTAIEFTSSFFIDTVRSTSEIKIKAINLPLTVDSTIYYWRSKLIIDTVWTVSSFTYINGVVGFGQFEIDQFYDNSTSGIYRDLELGEWSFNKVETTIEVNSAGLDAIDFRLKTNLAVNGQSLIVASGRGGCISNGVHVVVLDKVTGFPYNSYGVDAGNCGQKPRIATSLPYMHTENQQNTLISTLNLYPVGDYVVLQTTGNAYGELWSDSLKDVLASFGATKLDQLINGAPYVFVGQKGGQAFLEVVGENSLSEINEITTINAINDKGTVWSPLVGPSSHWRDFYSNVVLEQEDSVLVSFYGVKEDFTDSLMFEVSQNLISHIDLDTLTGFNSDDFPYAKLKIEKNDTAKLTAPQIDFWSIVYDGVPEGTLVFSDSVSKVIDQESIQVQEGEEVNIPFSFYNISRYDFIDSIEVEFKLIGQKEQLVWLEKYPALIAGDSLSFNYYFNSVGFEGYNSLQVFVNPYLQKEQDYQNNSFQLQVEVLVDNQHPLLDVTINDKHIRDAEWVLNSPVIKGVLEDDNLILEASDTSNFYVYFKKVCEECEYERIRLSDKNISYSSKVGEFEVLFTPGELEDGLYALQMYAFDASGNKSSEVPYEVTFEVKSTKSIELVGPYPNPSNREVNFVFDVSGAVPEDLIITIYNPLGRIVRVLNASDFERLQVGERGASLTWDATNDKGELINSGYYIYIISGSDDFNWTGDSKKGKFVLLR